MQGMVKPLFTMHTMHTESPIGIVHPGFLLIFHPHALDSKALYGYRNKEHADGKRHSE